MVARITLRFDSRMKSLAIRVLSDFGVDGIEPQALGSRKGRLALCALSLAGGQAVPADVLIDTLWGDAPPSRPEDQLAVLISRLRSVLGRDRIEHRDRGYLLICDWLDASELAAVTDEMERRRSAGNVLGAAAAARVALSLLRGYQPPPVPGEWAQLRLAELDLLVGRARRTAATVADGELRWHQGVVCLRALVEVASWVHQGVTGARAGHPWLISGPAFAGRLTTLTGTPVQAR